MKADVYIGHLTDIYDIEDTQTTLSIKSAHVYPISSIGIST